MCDQTEIQYLDEEVVWVKLGPTWWPGEVLGPARVPAEALGSLRKPPIAVVKFFKEDSLEFVKNLNSIYKYNCSRKHDFIKKGLDQYRSKHGHMELFPEYVQEAERRTHGDPHILEEAQFRPPQKVNYTGLFGTPKIPASPTKHKLKTLTSPSDNQHTPKITHPRILQKMKKGTSDYRAHILVQGEERRGSPPRTPAHADGHFTCHACSFSCTRINVMVLHNRCHSEGYVPYTPPKRHKRPAPRGETPRPRGRPRRPPPPRLPDAQPSPERQGRNESESEKPKTDMEIKNSLLADWSEDSDESMDILSSLKLTGNLSASENKEENSVSQTESGSAADADVRDEEGEDKHFPDTDRKIEKKYERKIGSCFDFDDDDEDFPIENIGRKIPRLSTKSEEGSRKASDISMDTETATAPLETKQREESGNTNSGGAADDIDSDIGSVISHLLEETAVPHLPSLPSLPSQPCEPKLTESLIKSPPRDEEKPPTKSIFKTKTFFRSRHTRSQDAIEKYVADNTKGSGERPITYMEEVSPAHPASVSSPAIAELKVPKFAPKIQLKRMKAALGDRVNSLVADSPLQQSEICPLLDGDDQLLPEQSEIRSEDDKKFSILNDAQLENESGEMEKVVDGEINKADTETPMKEISLRNEDEDISKSNTCIYNIETEPGSDKKDIEDDDIKSFPVENEDVHLEAIVTEHLIQNIKQGELTVGEEEKDEKDNIDPGEPHPETQPGECSPHARTAPGGQLKSDTTERVSASSAEYRDRWNDESVDDLLKSSAEEAQIEERGRTLNDFLGTMEEDVANLPHSRGKSREDQEMESFISNHSAGNFPPADIFLSSTEEETITKTPTQNIPTESDLQIAEALINLPTSGAAAAGGESELYAPKMSENDLSLSAAASLVQMSETLQGDVPVPSPALDRGAQESSSSVVDPGPVAAAAASATTAGAHSQTTIVPNKESSIEQSKLFKILGEPAKKASRMYGKAKSPIKIIQNKPVQRKEKILNFQVSSQSATNANECHKPRVIIRRGGAGAGEQQLVLTAKPGDAQTFTIEHEQPGSRLFAERSPVPVPRPAVVASVMKLIQAGDSTKEEEALFDINSMPIVLSEEILTAENLDKLPVVVSESSAPPSRAKVKVVASAKGYTPEVSVKKDKNKTVTVTPVKKYGQEPPGAKPVDALLKPPVEKSSSPNILSKSPKVKATKHLLVVDKTTGEQKIISAKAEEVALPGKRAPAPAPAPHKAEKFIVLPGSGAQKIIISPQAGRSQIILEESKPNLDTASPSPSGNTILILTNAQGVQSKIVLTPEHQRILFPKKGSAPVVTSQTVLSSRARATQAVSSQASQATGPPRGQLLSPISGNALITSTGQLLPPRQGRTVLAARPNQTILTSRGQLITAASAPVTSRACPTPSPYPSPSPSPRAKQIPVRQSAPALFIKNSSGKLISADPASILQGKKPGTVMHLTPAQFEHLQKTGQIISTQQPSLTQIVSPQTKAGPNRVQKFILHKSVAQPRSRQPAGQAAPGTGSKPGDGVGVPPGKRRLPSPSAAAGQFPPLKKQRLRELLTLKADAGSARKYSSPASRTVASEPQVMDLGNLDDLIPATTISTRKAATLQRNVVPTVSQAPPPHPTCEAAGTETLPLLRRAEPVQETPVPGGESMPAPVVTPETQLLAVPGENFGGPPNCFYLCMEENGTLTPIDNQPLVLENNQLVPMVQPAPVVEQRVILNTGEQQILVDQQTLLSLLGGGAEGRAGAAAGPGPGGEGQQVLLQGDVAQLQLLAAFAPQAPHSQDILAAALMDTGDSLLMEIDALGTDFHSAGSATGAGAVGAAATAHHSNVSETSTILKPIMSVTEQPSKKRSDEKETPRLATPAKLEDSLAVIGVGAPGVPTSLELPITVTDPRIAPKVPNPLASALGFVPEESKQQRDSTRTTASLLTRISQTDRRFGKNTSLLSNAPDSLPSREKTFPDSRNIKPDEWRRSAKQPASSMPCLDDSSSDSFTSDNPQLLAEAIQTKTYSPISMPLLTEDSVEEPLLHSIATPKTVEPLSPSMPVLVDSDEVSPLAEQLPQDSVSDPDICAKDVECNTEATCTPHMSDVDKNVDYNKEMREELESSITSPCQADISTSGPGTVEQEVVEQTVAHHGDTRDRSGILEYTEETSIVSDRHVVQYDRNAIPDVRRSEIDNMEIECSTSGNDDGCTVSTAPPSDDTSVGAGLESTGSEMTQITQDADESRVLEYSHNIERNVADHSGDADENVQFPHGILGDGPDEQKEIAEYRRETPQRDVEHSISMAEDTAPDIADPDTDPGREDEPAAGHATSRVPDITQREPQMTSSANTPPHRIGTAGQRDSGESVAAVAESDSLPSQLDTTSEAKELSEGYREESRHSMYDSTVADMEDSPPGVDVNDHSVTHHHHSLSDGGVENGREGEAREGEAPEEVAPSSVASEGPASPAGYSEGSSDSAEIPIQPGLCVSQRQLCKRSCSSTPPACDGSRSPPPPPPSPKRFKFHDER